MCFILSHLVISRSTVVDVLDFGWVISIATMTLTVNIANQRQHRRVTGAILERQAPYMWKQPDMRDFREVILCDFTELQIQILRMSRSTFVVLWRLLIPEGARSY